MNIQTSELESATTGLDRENMATEDPSPSRLLETEEVLPCKLSDFQSMQSKLRVAIVDDEPLARARLRSLLALDDELEFIGECGSGEEAVSFILANAPDFIFLDVQMPGLDGFNVLEALPSENRPAVIFATAFDHHALDAFDVQAVDYLLKPFRRERVLMAVTRVKERLRQSITRTEEIIAPAQGIAVSEAPKKLAVRNGSRTVLVGPKEVVWLEACANYVSICVANTKLTMRSTLTAVADRLPRESFLRVHRSFVINLEHVREVIRCGNGEAVVVMSNGRELPVGRTFKDNLETRISLR